MSSPVTKNRLPLVYNREKADEVLSCLLGSAGSSSLQAPDLERAHAISSNSPFLAALFLRYPVQAIEFLTQPPDSCFEKIVAKLSAPRDSRESEADFMAFLRRQKNLIALLVAIADISSIWSLEEVTKALSRFATLCLELAVAKALRARMLARDLPWPEDTDPSSALSTGHNKDCGYFILGLGKMGANELNYSSDIDLIALYDPETVEYSGRKSVSDCFIKLTQDVVRYIDQRTMDGYVFRVDLRLRPDPGATPVALSVGAAVGYYQSIAANWERSAMIKAAFAAGDQRKADAYLDELSSWVWRRNMDFEVLRDIAAIKNQINRHYGVLDADFAGFDVKLGLGGIREIEFYAQINQLLFGGRNPSLRCRSTLQALNELKALELLPDKTVDKLSAAYGFLRTVEHRIQMTNDEQCHSIPENSDNIKRLTCFLGYRSPADFEADLVHHTRTVNTHYDALLPENESTVDFSSKARLRVWLNDAGFDDPEGALNLISAWQYGRYRSLRASRARSLLTQCLPQLLPSFALSSSPDAALKRLDTFLAQLPAGVQFFSLLQANPSLLGLLARIIGLAPALSAILAKTPALWDAVLDNQFFEPVEDKSVLRMELQTRLSTARDYQDALDYVRRFFAETKFRCGVQMLEGIAEPAEVSLALSNTADVILEALMPVIEQDFAAKHGQFDGAENGIAILALGKYGGCELTHTSDIDIVFIYPDVPEGVFSNGSKSLSPAVYYTRLAQHIITAITALTPEGRLFDVDTRLRPSGTQGPLAVSLQSFQKYYRTSAWTWEFLALTRARLVHAPTQAINSIEKAISEAFDNRPEPNKLLLDSIQMRDKLASEFPTTNVFDIKHIRGGLVDIEFICQFLVLAQPEDINVVYTANVPECLSFLLRKGVLHEDDFHTLLKAYQLQSTVQSLLRLCLEAIPKSAQAIPAGLRETLCSLTSHGSFNSLQHSLRSVQTACHKLFVKLIHEQ